MERNAKSVAGPWILIALLAGGVLFWGLLGYLTILLLR